MGVSHSFSRFARGAARMAGSATVFWMALFTIALWAAAGPIFHYSTAWQTTISTASSIATLLMVFVIQNTQNHDALAVHLQLGELIRAVEGARNRMVHLEDLTDEELDRLRQSFAALAARAGSDPQPRSVTAPKSQAPE